MPQNRAVRLRGELYFHLASLPPAKPTLQPLARLALPKQGGAYSFFNVSLFLPSPQGSELRPSLSYTLHILRRTPSAKRPLPNPICAACCSFSPSIVNNSALEPEKTLKSIAYFLKDFFKRRQDICTSLPVPCFSVCETRKHVQTPTIHSAGMSLWLCLTCSKHQSCSRYKSFGPCKGTELRLL